MNAECYPQPVVDVSAWLQERNGPDASRRAVAWLRSEFSRAARARRQRLARQGTQRAKMKARQDMILKRIEFGETRAQVARSLGISKARVTQLLQRRH